MILIKFNQIQTQPQENNEKKCAVLLHKDKQKQQLLHENTQPFAIDHTSYHAIITI